MANIVSDDSCYMPRALIDEFMKFIARYCERKSCIRGSYFIALRLLFLIPYLFRIRPLILKYREYCQEKSRSNQAK